MKRISPAVCGPSIWSLPAERKRVSEVPPNTGQGIVLGCGQLGERFLKVTFFSPAEGLQFCLFRQSRKSRGGGGLPDVFDFGQWVYDKPAKGGPRFGSAYEALVRPSSLGRNLTRFSYVSRFGRLFVLNGRHWSDPELPFRILQRAMTLWEEGRPPALVYFRGLFHLLEGEGLPVRQEWFPRLPLRLRTICRDWIRAPWDELPGPPPAELEEEITPLLERWMETHHYTPWTLNESPFKKDEATP